MSTRLLDRTVLWREECAVTRKSEFTDEEWARVVRAPMVAGLAISLADPGGPIEAAKESMAAIKSATNPPSREELLTEIALDIQASVQNRHSPLKGYKPTRTTPPGDQVVDEVREVQAIVSAKATAEESAAFGRW